MFDFLFIFDTHFDYFHPNSVRKAAVVAISLATEEWRSQ